jgi:hypothetical protein
MIRSSRGRKESKKKIKKRRVKKKIAEAGVTATGNYTKIQNLVQEKNIPITEENLPKIKLGWVGKQKGVY